MHIVWYWSSNCSVGLQLHAQLVAFQFSSLLPGTVLSGFHCRLIGIKVGCTLLDYCSGCTEIQLRYIQAAQYILSFKPDTIISATSTPSYTSSHFSSLHETYEETDSYTLQCLEKPLVTPWKMFRFWLKNNSFHCPVRLCIVMQGRR